MTDRFILNGSIIHFSAELVEKQLKSETEQLFNQAEIEVMKLVMGGYAENKAKIEVLNHIQNGTGFARAFWNRQNALIRELENKLVSQPVYEYGKYKPDTMMKWVLGEVVTHHCNDCLRLSMMEPRTLAEWAAMDTGLPTQGKTACSFGCQCMLEPVGKSKGSSKTVKGSGQKKQALNPVSSSLQYNGTDQEYKDMIRRVLNAIDNIHDDGELNIIPVTDQLMEDLGLFTGVRIARKYPDGTTKYFYEGKSINVSPHADNKNLTFAHEIGHFIDYKGIGKPGQMSSIQSPIVNKWREAVLESKQYNYLVKLRDTVKDPESLEHLYYLLDMDELWARSYAQYVAQKSGDAVLLKELENDLKQYKLYQWNKKDFEGILKAFDEIFTELGWLL